MAYTKIVKVLRNKTKGPFHYCRKESRIVFQTLQGRKYPINNTFLCVYCHLLFNIENGQEMKIEVAD